MTRVKKIEAYESLKINNLYQENNSSINFHLEKNGSSNKLTSDNL